MERHDVERIVRGLLDDLGVGVELTSVGKTDGGWQIVLKGRQGATGLLILPDGPAPAIRQKVCEYVEANDDT